MVKLKDIGNFKSVPQIVGDIIKGNIPALDEYFQRDGSIVTAVS